MSDDPGTRLIVADKRHRWTSLDDEVILLHESKSTYYTLEGVAIRAWELLQEPRTVDQVVQVLTQEYDVPAEQCRRDLVDCVRDLIRHGFVEYQDESSG